MPSEARARQRLQTLINDYKHLSPTERAQMSEASVVRQFIDRLLEEVLGWPIKDPQRYKYELFTQVGRPDLTLIPEAGGTITPGQLALPGMAVDRTEEEQQAINYAFANVRRHRAARRPAERRHLHDEIDAIVAHLYGLSRADFGHILGTFPLIFPDTDEGRAHRDSLLHTYDEWSCRLRT